MDVMRIAVGVMMRRWCRGLPAIVVGALMLSPTVATAEVCDKAVGEWWQAANGPVWLLNEGGFPIDLTILLAGLVLLMVARVRWVGYVVSAVLLFVAAVTVFADLVPQHDSHLMEIREGCR